MSAINSTQIIVPHIEVVVPTERIDFSKARAAYTRATNTPQERHAEVGVLSPDGTTTFVKLAKSEEYGAHRVGSVTKTFTTFLAMKLANKGILPNGLETKCGDVISLDVLAQIFENPEAAKNMTLEQLLSHTSGLELDDHSRPQNPLSPPSSLQERFLQEPKKGRKYTHLSKPGEGIGFYSNAGIAVAGWMMEVAYNKHNETQKTFSQIMKEEVFEGIFGLSESLIHPGPTGDVIQSAAGDMTSSTKDLMKVAVRLQEGEASLEGAFGKSWQSTMLRPRDLFGHHGLGCSANAPVIQHAGMNREKFGSEERDVTALIQFPLHPGGPGLVAMCDSCALGPAPQEQEFIRTLEVAAGISNVGEIPKKPLYHLDFFCPPDAHLFHGNSYLATNVDPFAKDAPDTIICSRNGMKHTLQRDASIDGIGIRAYRDENKEVWLCISKDNGRKMIYSNLCLLTSTVDFTDLASKQPSLSHVQSLRGVYRDAEAPREHPTYTFTEKDGHLYMKEDNNDVFPCMYIPDDSGGSWVVSDPTGRSIKIHFPENPDKDPLIITDIFSGIQQLPHNSTRT